MAATYLNMQKVIDEKSNDLCVRNVRTQAHADAPLGTNWYFGTGTPATTAATSTYTITAANLLTGTLTIANTNATTATFDTAANLLTAYNAVSAGAVVGDYIVCLVCNGSSGANTITFSAGTGNGFDTNQNNLTLTQGQSKQVRIRFTNVTPGSAATTIYF